MDDIVFIESLRVDALIGVHEHERHARRPLVFDIEMTFDNRIPAASDSLADALDYQAVADRLRAFVEHTDYNLLETLAEGCAALILGEFGALGVRLKLSKPGAVDGADAVGVVIRRGRSGA